MTTQGNTSVKPQLPGKDATLKIPMCPLAASAHKPPPPQRLTNLPSTGRGHLDHFITPSHSKFKVLWGNFRAGEDTQV